MNSELPRGSRYAFADFTLSPTRRELMKGGRPVPLIPKYFDLLCLLVDRRAEALGRQVIFDEIWPDVVVSDSALTQAIRTLRRALEDSPRAPVFIRTVSRHGYQFVFEPVAIQDDGAAHVTAATVTRVDPPANDPIEPLIARVLGEGEFEAITDEERRDAATSLHLLGTDRALSLIEGKPGAERARALLRETRWDLTQAGDVPILAAPGLTRTVAALVGLRLHDAARAAAGRLGSAAGGGFVAGALGGVVGGLALFLSADSMATSSTVAALAIIGALAGLFGAGVIGAGLAAAEVLARSQRRLALVVSGALSGVVAGLVARVAVRAVLESLLGSDPGLVLGGPFEGAVMGALAGIGYAVSTHTPRGGGMATPRGSARLRAAVVTALFCALAGAALGGVGRGTVSVTLDSLSLRYDRSQVSLAPLAPFMGEEEVRPVTRAMASGFEGLLFGFGLAFGLTHRPSAARSR